MSGRKFKNHNGGPHVVGECRGCGDCCFFSYWVAVNQPEDFDYYIKYARRFFHDVELRKDSNVTGIVLVKDIPCRHLDMSDMSCRVHGTAYKSRDCQEYPFNWPADLFDKIRAKSCGYTVERKNRKK